jgi:uncharacterized membrane protein (UPF0182 family)
MTGLLVARNDGENYGELVLFRLPKSKIIYGPMQIEGFIDQETDISKEFSLWNSAGSSYTRGEMFVIPIEDSLVYVEPIYLEATNSSLPEVKRVIVYYNDKIAYEPTLAQALDTMFGAGSGSFLNGEGTHTPDSGTGTPSETPDDGIVNTDTLIRKAVDAYNKAVSAQEKGDWASYGEHLKELESYLDKLNKGSAAHEIPLTDQGQDLSQDEGEAADQ